MINIQWSKIALLAKNNWKEIAVIVCLSIVSLKTRMDYNALNSAYEASQAELSLQIESLRDIHAEELKQRDEAVESYRATLEKIELRYLESQDEIQNLKRKKTNNYVRQYSQDQEGLADEIIDAYGFERVE